MSTEYVKWDDVKAKARAVDPRSPAEREAGAALARERTEVYVRRHRRTES